MSEVNKKVNRTNIFVPVYFIGHELFIYTTTNFTQQWPNNCLNSPILQINQGSYFLPANFSVYNLKELEEVTFYFHPEPVAVFLMSILTNKDRPIAHFSVLAPQTSLRKALSTSVCDYVKLVQSCC